MRCRAQPAICDWTQKKRKKKPKFKPRLRCLGKKDFPSCYLFARRQSSLILENLWLNSTGGSCGWYLSPLMNWFSGNFPKKQNLWSQSVLSSNELCAAQQVRSDRGGKYGQRWQKRQKRINQRRDEVCKSKTSKWSYATLLGWGLVSWVKRPYFLLCKLDSNKFLHTCYKLVSAFFNKITI